MALPFLSRLSVHERSSEAMVGLLVSLGARGAVRITSHEPVDPVALSLVSLAAALTWAIIDAIFALLAAKGQRLRWAHLTDDARDPKERGLEWADEALSHSFLHNLEEPALERIRAQAVKEAALAQPVSARLTADDWLAGLAVFIVVGLAAIPPVLALLLIPDIDAAVWSSYGVTLLLLFGLGMPWGPAHGLSRLRSGLAILALGSVMVAILLLLGA